MQKILIIGESGSGKTTLGTTLSSLLNIPSFDLDDYYWLPGWQMRDSDGLRNIFKKIVVMDKWIISGDSSKIKDITWSQVDTIIWLDYNIIRCLYQGVIRTIKRIVYKQICCGGNIETVAKLLFSKESIIFHIVTSYYKRKLLYENELKLRCMIHRDCFNF